MNERAWEELVDLLDQKYEIDKHSKNEEPIEGNPSLKRQVEAVFFEKDNKKYKIERTVSPAVTDTKSHYTHRGAAQRVEKVYDRDETVSHVVFFTQQDDGYWNEITPEQLLS